MVMNLIVVWAIKISNYPARQMRRTIGYQPSVLCEGMHQLCLSLKSLAPIDSRTGIEWLGHARKLRYRL